MSTLAIALLALAKFLAIAMFAFTVAALLTWAERRQSAMIQDRLGPNRANIGRFRAWGLFHILADTLKMFFKEDFVPAKAHRVLFTLAPVLAMAPVMIVFAVIPFGPTICPGSLGQVMDAGAQCTNAVPLQVARLDGGLLFYFAIASFGIYGIALAGWASYNKWALLGGLRGASQMMSYEVTMGMTVLGAFLVYGTLEPGAIVAAQGPNPLHWGIVVQPLGFLLFLAAAIAETKRTPFDLPEGESELIGYFIEYSGMRFGMFYVGEFIEVVFASAIITTLFLGGWQFPGLHPGGFFMLDLPHWAVVLAGVGVWVGKVLFLCWLQLAIRWTLPRMRPDQLMEFGWKRLLPASIVNVLVTAGVVLAGMA